jgi:hypothetical protein
VLVSTALDIFDSEVFRGPHPPLILGWRDDQLAPVVEILDPLLPSCLPNKPEKVITPAMKCAIAACARSLVVEALTSGSWVRYSRHKDDYRILKRYRRGDRDYSWHFVTNAMDVLKQTGLIGHEDGYWEPSGGRQPVAHASPALRELLAPVIDIRELRGEPHQAEVIVLRDRKDKRDIDYDDTDETNALRAEVEALNDALGRLKLYRQGEPFLIPVMRRIFNGDINRGGRCYCHGTSFQNIRSEERLDLLLLIDGVLHPVIEIDYANLHAVMAYTEAGLPIPPGDQYDIDGIDRTVVKRAFNVLLNATKRNKAVAALVADLHHKDEELWEHSGLTTRLRSACFLYAEKVVAAIEDKHRPIAEYFGSDCGARFQRRDSDMAVRVMLRMIERTGRCPLPVHDSFLVADIDQEALAFTMQEVAMEEGLVLCLKVSRGPVL